MNLAAEARILWSLVPADCKSALSTIKRSGRWEEVKPVLIREAAASLKRAGSFSMLDICAALELAAEHWLQDNPVKDVSS